MNKWIGIQADHHQISRNNNMLIPTSFSLSSSTYLSFFSYWNPNKTRVNWTNMEHDAVARTFIARLKYICEEKNTEKTFYFGFIKDPSVAVGIQLNLYSYCAIQCGERILWFLFESIYCVGVPTSWCQTFPFQRFCVNCVMEFQESVCVVGMSFEILISTAAGWVKCAVANAISIHFNSKQYTTTTHNIFTSIAKYEFLIEINLNVLPEFVMAIWASAGR